MPFLLFRNGRHILAARTREDVDQTLPGRPPPHFTNICANPAMHVPLQPRRERIPSTALNGEEPSGRLESSAHLFKGRKRVDTDTFDLLIETFDRDGVPAIGEPAAREPDRSFARGRESYYVALHSLSSEMAEVKIGVRPSCALVRRTIVSVLYGGLDPPQIDTSRERDLGLEALSRDPGPDQIDAVARGRVDLVLPLAIASMSSRGYALSSSLAVDTNTS